jgi:hypothetical protein
VSKAKKNRGNPISLNEGWSMGADVGLEESCNLSLCALVGQLSYRSLCKQSLPAWVMTTWVPLLGYAPEVLFLSRGWFGFLFRTSRRYPDGVG